MGIKSPPYVGSTWPSNGGSYNWDVGLFSSWNTCLSSAFSHWGNAKCESWAPRFGSRGGIETRASDFVFPHWRGFRRALWASRLRRGLQALCLSTEVVLRRGLWALLLDITVVLRRGLWALRFAFAQVALISLPSEAWTMLSDDLSIVIFR